MKNANGEAMKQGKADGIITDLAQNPILSKVILFLFIISKFVLALLLYLVLFFLFNSSSIISLAKMTEWTLVQ